MQTSLAKHRKCKSEPIKYGNMIQEKLENPKKRRILTKQYQ
jgi:hypothetical protein